MSWQEFGDEAEYDDDVPAVTLGDYREGETISLRFESDPEEFHSDDYGPGVRAEATLLGSDYTHTDDDGDELEEGDTVTLVTWSKRLVRALAEFAGDAPLEGSEVDVTKHGSGYDTDYTVEAHE